MAQLGHEESNGRRGLMREQHQTRLGSKPCLGSEQGHSLCRACDVLRIVRTCPPTKPQQFIVNRTYLIPPQNPRPRRPPLELRVDFSRLGVASWYQVDASSKDSTGAPGLSYSAGYPESCLDRLMQDFKYGK
jgi:hypothetical protein